MRGAGTMITDFCLWTTQQADALRNMRWGDVDVEAVAEEIEDMGKKDKRELKRHLVVRLTHLLKWRHQPDGQGKSWRLSLRNSAWEMLELLADSPSLKRSLPEMIEEAYKEAVETAAIETDLPASAFPATCLFSEEQILDPGFLPETRKNL